MVSLHLFNRSSQSQRMCLVFHPEAPRIYSSGYQPFLSCIYDSSLQRELCSISRRFDILTATCSLFTRVFLIDKDFGLSAASTLPCYFPSSVVGIVPWSVSRIFPSLVQGSRLVASRSTLPKRLIFYCFLLPWIQGYRTIPQSFTRQIYLANFDIS